MNDWKEQDKKMSKADHPLRVGILLRNRHDGPGGLEKVLEIVARAMPEKNVELFFYSLYELKYDAFTEGFQNVRYLDYPLSINSLKGILPKVFFRAIQKRYVRSNGYRLFQQMENDHLDALITIT